MQFKILDWPLAIAFCALCFVVSVLALTRGAASFGLVSERTNVLSWLIRGARQDSNLRKVRIVGVGLVSLLMASYLLYLMMVSSR
jgi:hypothetical protein